MECIALTSAGTLTRLTPCDGQPEPICRVLAVRHEAGEAVYLRADLPARLRDRLAALPADVVMRQRDRVKALLAEHGPCDEDSTSTSYAFPDAMPPAPPDVARLGPAHRSAGGAFEAGLVERLDRGWPVFAVLAGGRIASMCVSARESSAAAEAWVATLPELRRRGYARGVTTAWGRDVRERGKTPVYSHAW
jgi:hypothetical protein